MRIFGALQNVHKSKTVKKRGEYQIHNFTSICLLKVLYINKGIILLVTNCHLQCSVFILAQ